MAEYPSAESCLGPEPTGSRAGRPMPLAVSYARALLWLQGVIWGGLALLMVIAAVVAGMEILADPYVVADLVVAMLLGVVTIFFAGGAIALARALARASDGARKTAIGVEIAMTLLGAMWAASSDFSGGLVADTGWLAATAGAGLSLAAVLCLLRRSARQYSALADNRGGKDAGLGRPARGPYSAAFGPLPADWGIATQLA